MDQLWPTLLIINVAWQTKILVVYVWLPDLWERERSMHYHITIHSQHSPSIIINARHFFLVILFKTLPPGKLKQLLKLKTMYLYVIVPSLFALSKRCLLLWWILLCPQTINITPWKRSWIAHFTSHIRPYNAVWHDNRYILLASNEDNVMCFKGWT